MRCGRKTCMCMPRVYTSHKRPLSQRELRATFGRNECVVVGALKSGHGSRACLYPSPKVESLTSKDAYMFPLYGSCALLGLYVVFKLVAAHIVNMLLTCYFVLLATAAVASVVRPVMQVCVTATSLECA